MRVRTAAIAGWTCSGKTLFSRAVAARLTAERAVVLSLDNYYRDTSAAPRAIRAAANYDEPDALDWRLFAEHFDALRRGGSVPRLHYDFGTKRRTEAGTIGPAGIVIAEGVLAFWIQPVWQAADLRIHLDGDPDRLFARRLARDSAERGYTAGEIRRRFFEMALPAQRRLLDGARESADLVIPMTWTPTEVRTIAALLAAASPAS